MTSFEDHSIRYANSRPKFHLLSFSPARGIGCYECDDLLHVVDLVAAQDLEVEPDVASYILTLVGQQLEARLGFASRNEMSEYMHQEYLRDKKNNYYAELFTTQMDEIRRRQLMYFLNDDKLRSIHVSQIFVKMLRKLGDLELIALVVQLARDLQLNNVRECLETDFSQVAFDAEKLKQFSVRDFASELEG